MRSIKYRIDTSSSLYKGVLKVVAGTAAAQLVVFATMPITARLYAIEAFGVLGLYVALSNIARVVFPLRYDYAIQSSSSRPLAAASAWLCIMLSLFSACMAGALMFVFSDFFYNKIGSAGYFIPILILISSFDNISSVWLNRTKRHKLYSGSRLIRAGSISVIQVALGYLHPTATSLVFAVAIGELITVVVVSTVLLRGVARIRIPSLARMRAAAYINIDSPKFLLPGHALNVGVSQLPILAISTYFGESLAGIFFMAQRIVSIPSQLVSNAVFRVFFTEANESYRKTGSCYALAKNTLILAGLVLGSMFFLLNIASYFGIQFIFGEEWVAARPTILIVSLYEFVPSVFLTISSIWFITGSEKINLRYQVYRSVIVLCGLAIGLASGNYYSMVILFGVFRSASFMLFLGKCMSLSRGVIRTSENSK